VAKSASKGEVSSEEQLQLKLAFQTEHDEFRAFILDKMEELVAKVPN
jgi:hypothetical protein